MNNKSRKTEQRRARAGPEQTRASPEVSRQNPRQNQAPHDENGVHYLKSELDQRLKADGQIVEFIESACSDGLWYLDVESPEHEWYSPGFAKLFGYETEEIPHLSNWWQQHIFPEDLPLAIENYQRHAEDPKHPFDQIVRYRHKDGSTVWVRCRGLMIRDDEGRPIRMLGVHSDVTDLKKRELELERSHALAKSLVAELKRSNEAFESYAHLISHELKEPLRVIASFVELLGRRYTDKLDERGQRFIGFAVEGAQRMTAIINDMLELAHIEEAEKLSQRVSLTVILEALSVELGIKSLGIDFRLKALPVVSGHALQLERMFANLLSNAVKFRQEDKPTIWVDAVEDGDYWDIRVRDNGIGFDSQKSEQIFGMFHRLHERSRYPGSGIGLALVEKIASKHGGRVWAEATIGEGATFHVLLPKTSDTEDES